MLFLQNHWSLSGWVLSPVRRGPEFSGVSDASGFVWTHSGPDIRWRRKADYQRTHGWSNNWCCSHLDESAVASSLASGLGGDSCNPPSVKGTYSIGAKTMEPLCPPKPNEFDIDGPGSQS